MNNIKINAKMAELSFFCEPFLSACGCMRWLHKQQTTKKQSAQVHDGMRGARAEKEAQ